MNVIILNSLQLKTFTEQDAEDYCQLNSINPDDIKTLLLNSNELTDITGIKLFKNLKCLYLYNNKLTDISVLKNLINLEILGLHNNLLTDISVLKNLINLKELVINNNEITDISVLKNLNKLSFLNINNLKLESDQIEYIKKLEKLKYLYSKKGFKDMNILNKLNKNIEITV